MLALKVGRDIFDYINNIRNSTVKQRLKKRLQEYSIDPHIVDGLERIEEKIFLVIISAEWSSEAHTCVSGLGKLLISANNTNLVAKVIDYDSNQDIVTELEVTKVPTVIVYDRQQHELGRFVQNVSRHSTVEEEILDILQRSDKIHFPEGVSTR